MAQDRLPAHATASAHNRAPIAGVDAPVVGMQSRAGNLDLAPDKLAADGAACGAVEAVAIPCEACAALAPFSVWMAMRRWTLRISTACTVRRGTGARTVREPLRSIGASKAAGSGASPP